MGRKEKNTAIVAAGVATAAAVSKKANAKTKFTTNVQIDNQQTTTKAVRRVGRPPVSFIKKKN